MRNIDRFFATLSSVFFALRELPSGIPDKELNDNLVGISTYVKLALERACMLVVNDDPNSVDYVDS